MKSRLIIFCAALFVAVVLSPCAFAKAAAPSAAQSKASKSQAAKSPSDKSKSFDPRDFNGVWGGQSTALLTRGLTNGEPSMTAWALERYKAAKTPYSHPPVTGEKINDPAFSCEPFGAPRIYFFPHPMKLIQDPNKIVMLFAADRIFRIIRLNAQHPEHPFDTFYGDSVGSWDGNTLVVDTVDFYNERTWLDPAGHPHSDQLHLTERLARPDRNHLRLDVTIEDPIAYSKPWGGEKTFTLEAADGPLHNVMCVPENKPQILKDFFSAETASAKK